MSRMAEYLSKEDMNTGEYISRDEALKIFHQGCDNCTSSYNGVMCRACADADAMDILVDIPAADVQPVNQWISVNDRLPEAVEEDVNGKIAFSELVLVYLVYNNGFTYITTDQCRVDDKSWLHEIPGEGCKVTHWQPLPEPPKDGETND